MFAGHLQKKVKNQMAAKKMLDILKMKATKPEQCLTALSPANLGRRLAKATAAIVTSVNVDKWQHKATTTDPG